MAELVEHTTTKAAVEEKAKLQKHFGRFDIFFFVPYALLSAELGSSFTEEGGAYIWVKLAFGRFTAAINSVLYWLSNAIWLGGTLTILAVTTFGEFFTPLTGVWKYDRACRRMRPDQENRAR